MFANKTKGVDDEETRRYFYVKDRAGQKSEKQMIEQLQERLSLK